MLDNRNTVTCRIQRWHDDDDCFYYYKKYFSTLDWGSMRSHLGIKIWDYRWFAFTSFAFLFRKNKYVKEKKQVVQDLISHLNTYIYLRTLYTYTNICMPRFSAYAFFGPSRCLIPTPGLTSEHLCSVCACVRIHTLTHTHTPTRVKNRKDTDSTTIFPSVKNSPPRQATSALID